ncbi:MAG: flagellar biosynthesis anti-sigma factor FlgM [Treponema sp.]|jgi:negative regulator of flagellin synthesis FlgM|nr:flagellar biosynthesis anti-sigma factor FlgM [Treponema sp.]
MTIDRIGSIDPIQPGKKSGRANQVSETPKTDSISISSEAVEKAELYRAMELAAAAPDVRADKVVELQAKINDPSYINDKVLNATADRIIDVLFG